MRLWFFLTVFALIPLLADAGSVSIVPRAIPSGGAALLRWHGEPPARAVAKYNGRLLSLSPTASGAVALLGADIDAAPGRYPVLVTVTWSSGASETRQSFIEILASSYPEERLTLPASMVSPKDPAVVKRIGREWAMLKETFSVSTPGRFPGPLILPVEDPVSSPFGLKRILNGKPKSPHAGIDFRSPLGTPVHASAAAEVSFSGDLYYTGKTVILDHGQGLFSIYAHLDSLACSKGMSLERGDLLGRVGSSGRSTGPHLHWGVKLRGDRIDPMALMALLAEEIP